MTLTRRYDPATGTLILTWREEVPADLRNRDCRRLVLEALREEPRVESVVLADHRERRYGKRAMAVLNALLGVERLAEQLAARDPRPDFPEETKRKTRARCAACPFHPRALAPGLARKLRAGLPEFHAEFGLRGRALEAHRNPGCVKCVLLAEKDLSLLGERYAALARLASEVG